MNRSFLLAVLFSCGAVASALAQGDPLSVARRYVDAVNHGDVTQIVALFTEDATVAHGRVCTPPCVGDLAAEKGRWAEEL